jgi:CBS domain-containing protein
MKTVHDILTGKLNWEVWSIDPKATVFEAMTLMGEKQVGALMATDGAGKVAGIISERDYARKVILKGRTSKETRVEEIMTPMSDLYVVSPEATIQECMVLMTGKRIRHLPVFRDHAFQGVVSIGDVVKSVIAEQETVIEQLTDYISGKYM